MGKDRRVKRSRYLDNRKYRRYVNSILDDVVRSDISVVKLLEAEEKIELAKDDLIVVKDATE